ncbi:unnamed protein product [Prunus armeniaca]|uniref:Uncharacterized protein n=1 Tax=Prunus armeniaca TaxID=36596 RepID=A0A6J5W480_PRUAR|nr:unnamed protein product [Prunus armeniaca]
MPNVIAATGVGRSILDFFNMRKAKEQQEQLDENVKSSTLITWELNKSTQVLQSKVDAIQAPSQPP